MMEDGTIRSGRRKPFVVLYREVAQDGRLSLAARGLFAVMASLPEDWSYTVAGLARVAQCSKYRVRLMLEELEKVGYLVRAQSHGDGGKFGPNTYILQDERVPFGWAVQRNSNWAYHISPGGLVKYKHGELTMYKLRDVSDIICGDVSRMIDQRMEALGKLSAALLGA